MTTDETPRDPLREALRRIAGGNLSARNMQMTAIGALQGASPTPEQREEVAFDRIRANIALASPTPDALDVEALTAREVRDALLRLTHETTGGVYSWGSWSTPERFAEALYAAILAARGQQ